MAVKAKNKKNNGQIAVMFWLDSDLLSAIRSCGNQSGFFESAAVKELLRRKKLHHLDIKRLNYQGRLRPGTFEQVQLDGLI